MENRYEIDFAPPTLSRCDCRASCGALAVRVTGFVERHGARPSASTSDFSGSGDAGDGGPTETGDAYAVYFAAYENAHPEELAMLISLGDWSDEGDPSTRAAFFCRVRPGTSPDANYEVTLDDAAASPWAGLDIVGEKLSQQEARRHPDKARAFEVLDAAFRADASLKGFLARVRCGAPTVPLEYSFQAPDVIFARRASGGGYGADVELGRNWAVLRGDGDARHFIRVLLPIPVEGYGDWRVGVWVAVTAADYVKIGDVWEDPLRYATLTFTGRIANDSAASLDLPLTLGDDVDVHTPEPDMPPLVKASPVAAVAALLAKRWAREDFEEYAVARGFL